MKTIKDSVHDHIEVVGVANDLLDTHAVQRLRHITQLGTARLVYPSANHTRFEHSLGVYHLAREALTNLGIEGVQAERVRAAALLHDIGHSPYSHTIEELIHRRTGKYHDDVHDLLADTEVGDILREHDLDPDTIAVFGASGSSASVGAQVFSNLVTDGFEGTIYPSRSASNERPRC